MVFYFTATGNSLYVAKCIDEYPVSIPQAIKNSSIYSDSQNKGFNRTVISITSWEFHPGMVLMQPYPLPATLLTLGLWL